MLMPESKQRYAQREVFANIATRLRYRRAVYPAVITTTPVTIGQTPFTNGEPVNTSSGPTMYVHAGPRHGRSFLSA